MDVSAQSSSAGFVSSLEDALVNAKIITPEQRSLIKLEHDSTGKPIEQLITEHGFASDHEITAARAALLGVPTVDLATKQITPEVFALVPESVMQQYQVVPFAVDAATNILSVAMADPLDITATTFLERKTGRTIHPYLASADVIASVIESHSNQNLDTEVNQALKDSPMETAKQAPTQNLSSDIIRDAPVAKIVSSILDFALKARVSDVHIEALSDHTRIRYRIDGILQEKLILPLAIHDALVSRIKILAGLKIDEKRVPQDGRFNYIAPDGGGELDIRVSTLPTVHGEKVVMRLLRKTGGVPTFADLGLRGLALKNLEIAILRPHGVIVICGPTGSGKTTTLYSVLSKISSTRVNTVTIEDPVEYQIPGVNQVQVNPAAGLTFATALRSFLRQDPNVILVGEIRDRETTDLAIQAALTGHLVFSTLHTSNAAGSVPRFIDLGAEPFLLASSLNAVVGQRILRKLCPHCKESFEPPAIMVTDIKNVLGKYFPTNLEKDGKVMLYKGKGCQECANSGFLGRIGIYEVLPITDSIAKLILSHADANEIEEKAIAEGMLTMKQDGYLKALEGVTTIEEVIRVAQD